MTTITTPYLTHTAHRSSSEAATPSRAWSVAGIAAGVTALAGMVASLSIGATSDRKTSSVDTLLRDQIGAHRPALVAFHVLTMVSVLVLPVFAAGLARRIRHRVPTDSLLPTLAFFGLSAVSLVGLLGTGLDTEFINGPIDQIAPASSTAFYAHWIATIPWLWAGAGIAALAVAAAGRMHAAVPTWMSRVSIVLGGLTVLTAASPLQYLSNLTGLVWLLVIAVGFTVGDKEQRHAA